MKVIYIDEECHGFIGLAKDYKSAIHFLLNSHWLEDSTEICVGEEEDGYYSKYSTLKEYFGEGWIDLFCETWNINDFNNFFSGSFWLEEVEVYDS